MQYLSPAFFRVSTVLLACILASQLTACGSDADPLATATAGELRTSSALPDAGVAPVKAASTDASVQTGTTETVVAASNVGTSSVAPGTTTVNTPAISSSDPRVVYWVDPRKGFADLRKWGPVTQVHGPNMMLADVAEPGIIGAGSDYAFSRVSDPLDSRRAAFRHRLSGTFPTWGNAGARRSEISANWSNDGTNVTRGVDYWIAFAVKFDPDMFGSGNSGASLVDFHQVPDSGEAWLPSSLSMYAGEDNISFVVRWDSAQPSIPLNPPSQTLWRETSPSTTEWHRFVMKVRLHWDPARKPYVRVWRSIGDAPLQQIVSYDGPNDYNNNAAYIPQKFGLYRWDSWTGKPTRTIYTKGYYVIKDGTGSPTIDAQSMLHLLNGI